jgi:type II secretion system protein N
MRLSFSQIGPLLWGKKSSTLLLVLSGCLLFLILFLFGFFTTFPNAVLHDRVVAEVNRLMPPGNSFEAHSVSLGFPFQLQVDEARVILPASSPLPELIFSTISLSPALSIFSGEPGLSLYAESDFGLLDGTILRFGEVDLHLQKGRFDLPIPGMANVQLAGTIVAVDLVGQLQGTSTDSIRFTAVVEDLSLKGADQIGLSQNELPLGTLGLEVTGSNRSLQVEKLSLTGGVASVSGAGKVIVQRPFEASRLDLKLNIRPETSAGSGVRTLLELLGPPQNDGTQSVHLRGRLSAPQLK